MNILYGGAFNPPTIAHFEIIKVIKKSFPNDRLILLPAGDKYKDGNLIEFKHRYNMLKILVDKIDSNIIISDYENKIEKFIGTYYTLKFFRNPHFVIGADQLRDLHGWINFNNIIKENKFIVFPRDGIDMHKILSEEPYSKHKNNFILMDNEELNVSSSDFRFKKQENVLDVDVLNYIKSNNLYEV
ncbi:MAG: nicotinate-nicotinamide nucleotide adenylyltransferase [Bacilli bacterium]